VIKNARNINRRKSVSTSALLKVMPITFQSRVKVRVIGLGLSENGISVPGDVKMGLWGVVNKRHMLLFHSEI
jgi:hypothetical protein